jgi:hypothetical protein
MGQREFSTDRPPICLTEYFERGQKLRTFRRRAVLMHLGGGWQLAGCSIEAFPSVESLPPHVESRHYPLALLHEDVLTGEECLEHVEQLHRGQIKIADIELKPAQNPQWCSEFLSVNNDYMTRAGHVVSLRFSTGSSGGLVGPLLVPDQPYYPDTKEAARDWLPFAVHHGDTDTRYEQIVFLLPQTKAYIAEVTAPDDRTLTIAIEGSTVTKQQFIVKGAYWEGRAIRQLHSVVVDGKAQLEIPDAATRVEYYLIDSQGATYDFQHEDRFGHSGFGRRAARSAGSRSEQVRNAVREAEGIHAEFKPFVDPADKLARNGRRTKFGEVVTTVVAFANRDGGCIYLGIEDDCTITGIDQDLATWAKAEAGESSIRSYLGSLQNQLKARIDGDVALELAHVVVEGKLVAVINVSRAANPPASVQGDAHLYVRTGPNNRKVSPQEWTSALRSSELSAASEYQFS